MFNIVWDYRGLQWSLVNTRKPTKCIRCSKQIPVGRAYRPLTNGNERMNRLCVDCGTSIESRRERMLDSK